MPGPAEPRPQVSPRRPVGDTLGTHRRRFSPKQVRLTWTAATDDVGVTGYRLSRDGTRQATVSTLSWSDRTVPTGLHACALADGLITSYLSSDEGVELWIDRVPAINDWTAHLVREAHGTVLLTANQAHDIRIDYYEKTGAASVQADGGRGEAARALISRREAGRRAPSRRRPPVIRPR